MKETKIARFTRNKKLSNAKKSSMIVLIDGFGLLKNKSIAR